MEYELHTGIHVHEQLVNYKQIHVDDTRYSIGNNT